MVRIRLTGLVLLCLAMDACHGRPRPPTGQVAAVVDGHEITVRQIDAELNGALPSDPARLKAVQQRALQGIILRTLIADKARQEKLDRGPDFVLQEQQLRDSLLAHLYQQRLVAAIPAPTDEEVQSYIDAHPNLFAQRKIFTLDQVKVAGAVPASVVKALEPLHTLDAAKAVLTSNGLNFQQDTVDVDSIAVDPRLADALAKLAADDILIIPQPGGVVLNAVKSSRVQPLTGDGATTYARTVVRQQSIREAEGRQLQGLLRDPAAHVVYNAAYRPAPPPNAAPR